MISIENRWKIHGKSTTIHGNPFISLVFRTAVHPFPFIISSLSRWHIVSASMTPAEQRAFLHMRRTEELAKVEEIEVGLQKRIVQLWWMPGKFGYVISLWATSL